MKNIFNPPTRLRLFSFMVITMGTAGSAFSQSTPPEENRFTKSILTEKLDEPMEMTFLPDKRVLFIERKGNLKAYNPKTKEVSVLATIPVNTKYTNREGQVREAEEGLMGLIADPNYAQNH